MVNLNCVNSFYAANRIRPCMQINRLGKEQTGGYLSRSLYGFFSLGHQKRSRIDCWWINVGVETRREMKDAMKMCLPIVSGKLSLTPFEGHDDIASSADLARSHIASSLPVCVYLSPFLFLGDTSLFSPLLLRPRSLSCPLSLVSPKVDCVGNII